MKKITSLALVLVAIISACNDKPKKKEFGNSMEITDTYKKDAYSKRDENHPDAKVIKQLIEAGADLTKPHKPDFQFDFKEVEDARNVAKILLEDDFESKIYAPQKGFPTYELIAQKEMIIEFTTMADLIDHLRSLAVENNGEMSGWGTSVEE